jgi:hypothetical protein
MRFEEDRATAHETAPSLTGHTVVDPNLKRIGTVTDVLYDEREQSPRWAVVKTGIVGGEHFVPLAASYVDEDGRLIVPHDKASIKHAPRAGRDHVVTHDVDRKLREHYRIAA